MVCGRCDELAEQNDRAAPSTQDLLKDAKLIGDEVGGVYRSSIRELAARLESSREAMRLARDAFDREPNYSLYSFERDALKRLDEELAK